MIIATFSADCPSTHNEFRKIKCVTQETSHKFVARAYDQIHEEVNGDTKSAGDVIRMT